MSHTEQGPQPRIMAITDLDGVAKLHRQCFPGTVSIFTPLGDSLLKRYYAQAIEEDESFAAVLEEPVSKEIVGLAIATVKQGYPRRFIWRNFISFISTIFFKLLTSPELRLALRERLKNLKRLISGTGETELIDIGTPPMEGKEAYFMLSGVDINWRGNGNPEAIINYCVNLMFDNGITRIRGSIAPGNLASLILFKRLGWNTQKVSKNEICAWMDKTT